MDTSQSILDFNTTLNTMRNSLGKRIYDQGELFKASLQAELKAKADADQVEKIWSHLETLDNRFSSLESLKIMTELHLASMDERVN